MSKKSLGSKGMKSTAEMPMKESEIRELARQAFAVVDVDSSGYISIQELQTLMIGMSKSIGVGAPSPDEVKEAMDALDKNKDGQVSFEEFLELVRDILRSYQE
jgi:Ca2+-binding EF-hand superfamily protein